MNRPPLLDQRNLMPAGSTDCGEASAWMCLQAYGLPVAIEDILAYHSSYTDTGVLVELLHHFGLPQAYVTTGGFDCVNNYVICLIHDNASADPDVNGPYDHYIVAYGEQNLNGMDVIDCVNPWGGRDVHYQLSTFNAAFQAAIVIPPMVVKEADMTPADKQLIGNFVVRLGAWTLGRPGMSVEDQKSFVAAVQGHINDGDFDAAFNYFESSQEAQAFRQKALDVQGTVLELQKQVVALQAGVAVNVSPADTGPLNARVAAIEHSLSKLKADIQGDLA